MTQSTIIFSAPQDNVYRRSSNARQVPLSNTTTSNGETSFSLLYSNVSELQLTANGASIVGCTTSNGVVQVPLIGNSAGSINVSLARSTFLSNVQHIGRVGSLDFSANGNLLYLMDDYNGVVSMTNLGASFNVASACTNSIYNRANSWLRVQLADTSSVFSSPAGDNIYVMSSGAGMIQYTLSNSSDLYTAVNVASRPSSSYVNKDISIGRNGGNVYISYINGNLSYIARYPLSTPWSLATFSGSTSFYELPQSNVVETSHYINSIGTNLYYYVKTANNTSAVYKRNITTPWIPFFSVSNGSYTVPSNVVSTALGLEFSDDGTKMYLNGDNKIHTFRLENAWSIAAGVTYDSSATIPTKTRSRSITFSNYGNNVMYCNFDVNGTGNSAIVHREVLTEAWNVASYVISNTAPGTLFLESGTDTPTSISFSSNGARLLVGLYSSNNYIKQYDLSDSWNLQSAVLSNVYTIPNSNQVGQLKSFNLLNDNVLYAMDSNNSAFRFDTVGAQANSLTFNSSYTFTGNTATRGLAVTPNSKFIFSTSTSNVSAVPILQRHTMNTAGDLSTAEYIYTYTLTYPIGSEAPEWGVTGMFISNSGKKLFFQDYRWTYEYSLSTPWDFSTIRYVRKANTQFKLGAGATGLYFSPNGEYAYSFNTGSTSINVVRMSKPWDITTFGSSSTQNFTLFGASTIRNMKISPNGKYFVLAESNGTFSTYILSATYDITTRTAFTSSSATFTDIDYSPCGRYFMTLADGGLGSKRFDTWRVTSNTGWDYSSYAGPVNSTSITTFPLDRIIYNPMGDTIIGFSTTNRMLYKIRM